MQLLAKNVCFIGATCWLLYIWAIGEGAESLPFAIILFLLTGLWLSRHGRKKGKAQVQHTEVLPTPEVKDGLLKSSLKIALLTLFIGHIVWWPVWFVVTPFIDQDGFLILGAGGLVVGFGGTYYFLQNASDNAKGNGDPWWDKDLIWQVGLLFLPAITITSYAWIFG